MKVVLDTNIIVSALNFPGNERRVLDLARRGRYDLYLSPFIFQEISGVLVRKFRWDEQRTVQAVRMLRGIATIMEPQQRPSVIQRNEAPHPGVRGGGLRRIPGHRGSAAPPASQGTRGHEDRKLGPVPFGS